MKYTIMHENNHSLNKDYINFVVMNKSNHSYAINRKITEVFNSNSWKGRRCFIIGGGPSLKDFNFDLIKNELSIGINKSFQFFPNVTINYSMDSDFYRGLKEGRYDSVSGEKLWDKWMSMKGTRVLLTPMEIAELGKEVYLIRRIMPFKVSRNIDEGIHGGRNSGLGAIMLASVLGVDTIYLLGYDMKINKQTHWHTGYPNRDYSDFAQKLTEYKEEIEYALSYIKEQGIDVINLGPDSDLKCIKNDTLENVLRD
jgi:hypothetical protein